jgi:hypothetical protein
MQDTYGYTFRYIFLLVSAPHVLNKAEGKTMIKYSRKRFQEALRACKEIAKNSRLPVSQRLRAAELIYLLYGGELPGGNTKRDKRTIKDLVQERSVEKQIRSAIDEQTKPQTAEQAEEDKVSAALKEFLKPTKAESTENSKPRAETPATAQTVPVLTKAEEREQKRWLHALAVVTDQSKPEGMRLAAIVRVQSGLHDSSSLKHTKAPALLNRVLPPWSEREYREGGRVVMKRVSNPPISVADVWD